MLKAADAVAERGFLLICGLQRLACAQAAVGELAQAVGLALPVPGSDCHHGMQLRTRCPERVPAASHECLDWVCLPSEERGTPR